LQIHAVHQRKPEPSRLHGWASSELIGGIESRERREWQEPFPNEVRYYCFRLCLRLDNISGDYSEPTNMLETIANLATALGIPLGLFGVALGYIASRKSTDIQTVTALSVHFQNKWETSWREICRKGVLIDDISNKRDQDDLRDALNWIDWLGVLVQTKSFANPNLILRSISSSLKQIILLGLEEVNREGPQEWPGVFEVARLLKIGIRGNKISG
jgi:hypothetical protein